MFTYFYRIYDRYNQRVTAIAIYTGDQTTKNYDKFEYDFLGTQIIYQFNTYKISLAKEKSLLTSTNPFSLVVLASQYLLKTKDDLDKRYVFKHKLIRLAKERNYHNLKIISLLKFIYLILKLPEDLEIKFDKEIIKAYKKSNNMAIKKSDRFSNQLHLATYGESFQERKKRESIVEKTIMVQKLLRTKKLSIDKIADVVDESRDFVLKIKNSMD